MSVLQALIGLVATKVEVVYDYLLVAFSDGTTLRIFNNYVYDGASVLSLEGNEVRSIVESNEGISIGFCDGRAISVGLKDEDYNGPEAMTLNQEEKPTVVWN